MHIFIAFTTKQAYPISIVKSKEILMSDTKHQTLAPIDHAHPNGRRCCGRPLTEKCTPEEEATKTDPQSGEKSCCKGKH